MNKRWSMKLITFIILIALIFTACHPIFCIWDFGYDQLKEITDHNKIIDTYHTDDRSKKYLSGLGYPQVDCSLELKAGGNFEFTNAPDNIFNDGKSNKELINQTGKWNISCGESYGCM